MKRMLFTTTTVFSVIAASASFAGNLSDPVITPAPAPMPAPIMQTSADWTGFYLGGSLGYADATEDSGAFDEQGVTYGVHAGYDYDFGSFVLGGETELSGFNLDDGVNSVNNVARFKARAGYDAGAFLPYVTAGAATMKVDGLDRGDWGSFYGIGMDYMLNDGMRVGGEVLQHQFDDFDGTGLNFDATTASLRVAFQF